MPASSLAMRLRESTHGLHRLAERSRLMKRLLQGRIEQDLYCRLLRNLHALYSALEGALRRHSALPAMALLELPPLFRATALANDLQCLHGPEWDALPLTKSMRTYVERIGRLADFQPETLIAHAYVRYMGDLSGGQLVGNIVRSAFALNGETGSAFYSFGSNSEVEAMKARFRQGLDNLPIDHVEADLIVSEAQSAFVCHVAFFDELDAALGADGAATI